MLIEYIIIISTLNILLKCYVPNDNNLNINPNNRSKNNNAEHEYDSADLENELSVESDWALPLFWDLEYVCTEEIIRGDVLRMLWIYAKVASRTDESVSKSQALKRKVSALLDPPELKLKLVGRE